MNQNNINTNSIKQLLNHATTQLDPVTISELRAARTRALERHRALQQAPVLAWLSHHGLWHSAPSHSHKNMQWAIALLFALCLLSGAAYYQHAYDHDHSEIDIAILADDLPFDAYVE